MSRLIPPRKLAHDPSPPGTAGRRKGGRRARQSGTRPAASWLGWAILACLAVLPEGIARQAAPTSPQRVVNLAVSITNTPEAGPDDQADDRYAPGSEITYTLRASNLGSVAVGGARLRSALPDGIDSARWTCAGESGASCARASGDGGVDESVSLQPGASVVYHLSMTVPANYPASHAQLTTVADLALPAGMRAASPADLQARDVDTAAPAIETPVQPEAPAVPAATGLRGGPTRRSGGGLTGPALPQASFATCGPEMYITQGPNKDTNTTLSRVDTSTIPFTLTPIGTGSVPYNAVGFRPADLFLYGIRIGTRNLIRIHSDGSTEAIGAITGLPVPADSFNAGEIGTDGFMYVKQQDAVNVIYRIDLSGLDAVPATAPVATAIPLVLNGNAVSGADFAWINNRLYSVNQDGRVIYIDPASGVVTALPTINAALGNVGSLFGTPNALYGSRNPAPGGFYEFDLVTGAATRLSGSPPVGTNDGAHCASAAITFETDVGVSKTNTPAQGPNDLPDDIYTPGTNVVYTIVVSNRGPVGVQNMPVVDALPAGITTASWTCTITQGNGACGQASGTGAINDRLDLEYNDTNPVVAQATYVLTMSVPADYPLSHAALSNTVTISLPPGYTDPTLGDHTATDTDPASVADLQVVKSTPATSASVGTPLTYTITASNLGPADVANAVLTDVANARLDCVTPSPTATCTATGAAACPAATVPVSALFGAGVTIPILPANNGQIQLTLTCVVVP